jgi:hypothetical protein
VRVRILLRPALGVVLAGVLLAALAVPLFLTPGLATTRLAGRVSLQTTDTLDDPLPGNTQVLAADGSLITDFHGRGRAGAISSRRRWS